jgi:hypothetical protein
MRSPQAFVGFPEGEAIDILVVSYSKDQTELTTFDKIKQRMKNWHWLKREYTVYEDERIASGKGKPVINIMKDKVITYNNIRIFSQHSANESYEGYNVIFWVMSESSAFQTHNKVRNGDKVFATLRSSAASRFGQRWKGLVVSFPRFDQSTDFTYKLYKMSKDHKDEEGEIKLSGATIWAVTAAPWEYKPWVVGNRVIYSGEMFEFEGRQIPVELQQEFTDYPETCRMVYLCDPPPGGQQIFNDEVITTAMRTVRLPILTYTEMLSEGNKRQIVIHGLNEQSRFMHDYTITVDLGKKNSAAVMALSHIEMGRYFLDAILAWTPDKRKGIEVDLLDVKKWIREVAQKIPRIRFFFDQWQSELFKDEAIELDIQVGSYHTYVQDYTTFKQGVLLGKVELLDLPDLAVQLNAIRENDKEVYVDKTLSPRMDMVDTVVGGFKILMSEGRQTDLPGMIIGSNLKQFGMII